MGKPLHQVSLFSFLCVYNLSRFLFYDYHNLFWVVEVFWFSTVYWLFNILQGKKKIFWSCFLKKTVTFFLSSAFNLIYFALKLFCLYGFSFLVSKVIIFFSPLVLILHFLKFIISLHSGKKITVFTMYS